MHGADAAKEQRSPPRIHEHEPVQEYGRQHGEQEREEGDLVAPGRGQLALDHFVWTLVVFVRLLGTGDLGLMRGARGGGRQRWGRGWRRGRRGWRRRTGRVLLGLAAHAEHQLHVVGEAAAAYAPVQVVLTGRADEVVVLPREELQPARLRRERPEGDGEEHQLVRLVADGYYPRVGVCYSASVVLLLGHIVDDVLLGILIECVWSIHRADDVHLVVLELAIALVKVEDVVGVVYPKDAVRGVPVDVEGLGVVAHHGVYVKGE